MCIIIINILNNMINVNYKYEINYTYIWLSDLYIQSLSM